MKSISSNSLGYVLSVLVVAAVLAIGFQIPSMDPPAPETDDGEDSFPPIIPSENPLAIQEQFKMRGIATIARRMEDDYETVMDQYDRLPRFTPPGHDRLTDRDLEKYISAYLSYTSRFKKFKNKYMDGSGALTIAAAVGPRRARMD